MFEATFKITALVKSDGQGERVFRITQRDASVHDAEFQSLLATLYRHKVSTMLQVGDDLTIAVRLDLPPREIERSVHLREDLFFTGKELPQPLADPLPFLQAFYEPLLQQVEAGDVFTITFRVQRP